MACEPLTARLAAITLSAASTPSAIGSLALTSPVHVHQHPTGPLQVQANPPVLLIPVSGEA